MIKWNQEKRCLEHVHDDSCCPKLQEVAEPKLFKDFFPYVEVPRLVFDHKIIPICPAKEMFITDTTFRDGQQSQPPFTVKQICDLFDFLHQLGGPKGMIRFSEFFLYTKKDKEAVAKCLEKGYEYPKITAWIRAKREDLSLVKEMGLKETGILTSVSDYHIFYKLRSNRREILERYLSVIKEALSLGIIPRCHFEDVTRADIHGFCVPFARELMKLREESKIDIKIRLCDTLGLGVPYSEAALPRSVPKLIRAFIEDAGVPEHLLEWHGHNDFHKGLINAVTAWLYGCSAINGTLLGIGERTGNTPIEALVIELMGIRGEDLGMRPQVITEIARYFEKERHYRIPPNYPFVGKYFNDTKAGIHVDGLLKNREIYTIFDTERILNRPITITITDKSGTAGVAYWINEHFNLLEDQKVDKRHPGVVRIYKEIMAQYESGRVTPISNQEMQLLVRKYLPDLFASEFDKLKDKVKQVAAKMISTLMEHPDVVSMIPERQEKVLKEFIDQHPYIQFAYVTDNQGIKITHNITHLEDKAKYENMKPGEDLSNRTWFIEPMRTGKIYVSDLYSSRFTGALILTISAPIINTNDEIVGVLGLDIRFENLVKLVEDVCEE